MLGGVLGRYIQGGVTFKGALLFSVYGTLNSMQSCDCMYDLTEHILQYISKPHLLLLIHINSSHVIGVPSLGLVTV